MTYKIVLTPKTKHWAKLVEKDTEKFVQWLSNPYEQNWCEKCEMLLKKIYEKAQKNILIFKHDPREIHNEYNIIIYVFLGSDHIKIDYF